LCVRHPASSSIKESSKPNSIWDGLALYPDILLTMSVVSYDCFLGCSTVYLYCL
jgi:hypothetical protein